MDMWLLIHAGIKLIKGVPDLNQRYQIKILSRQINVMPILCAVTVFKTKANLLGGTI